MQLAWYRTIVGKCVERKCPLSNSLQSKNRLTLKVSVDRTSFLHVGESKPVTYTHVRVSISVVVVGTERKSNGSLCVKLRVETWFIQRKRDA